MFEVVNNYYLHFKGSNIVELPLNCSSCFSMFFNCVLPEGFTLGDKFDTSHIISMSSMFCDCVLPEGFYLGDNFDTFSVESMCSMFYFCNLPEDFSLGNEFDISSVEDMDYMFSECTLPEGKSGKDFNSEIEIIEWLKSRDKQSRDKQGAGKLSVF